MLVEVYFLPRDICFYDFTVFRFCCWKFEMIKLLRFYVYQNNLNCLYIFHCVTRILKLFYFASVISILYSNDRIIYFTSNYEIIISRFQLYRLVVHKK